MAIDIVGAERRARGGSSGGGSSSTPSKTQPTGDIWEGVKFPDSIVNPGSVFQTYDPKTGTIDYSTGGQSEAPYKALTQSSLAQAAKGITAPNVVTPSGLPSEAMVYQGGNLGYQPISEQTAFKQLPGMAEPMSEMAAQVTEVPQIEVPEIMTDEDLQYDVKDYDQLVNLKERQQNALKKVIESATGRLDVIANADFVQGAAMAALGRPATTDELAHVTQGGAVGGSLRDVLTRFGLGGQVPGFNLSEEKKVISDELTGFPVSVDEDGTIAAWQSPTFVSQMTTLANQLISLTKPSSAELKLEKQINQLETSFEEGLTKVQSQTIPMTPLIGQAAILERQFVNRQNALARRLGIAQSERQAAMQSTQAAINLQFQIQDELRAQRQELMSQMNNMSSNARTNLSMMMDMLAGTDPSKLTMQQSASLANMAKQAGIDPSIMSLALGNMYSQVENNKVQNQAKLLSIGDQLKLLEVGLTYDNRTGDVEIDTSKVSAEQIADAIAEQESGGNFNAQGGSGEKGAFQFMPDTWLTVSRQYRKATEGFSAALPFNEENERKVAVWKIRQLQKQGNSPREIALIWNTSLGGSEQPLVKSGINNYGQPYNSGMYADSVIGKLTDIVVNHGGQGDINDFDMLTTQNLVLSAMPVQLRNSEAEREQIQNYVKMGIANGLTATDMIDVLTGYKIDKPSAFSDNLRDLFGQANLAQGQPRELAKLINKGENSAAMRLMENAIMNRARTESPDAFISETKVKIATERANSLLQYVNSLEKSPINITTGNIEQFVKQFRSVEGQQIASQITNMTAKLRNDILGSAVTPTEARTLEPIIPALNDTPANFMIKLQNLKTQPLLELNNLRSSYALPELNTSALLNDDLRTNLYKQEVMVPNLIEIANTVILDDIDFKF